MDDLLLISGNDIPFPEAQLVIHQPSLKEIAFIGELAFFTGCELINFSKVLLEEQDKINLENKSNFDIIMSVVNDKTNEVTKENAEMFITLLELILPQYQIKILKDQIVCFTQNEAHSINNMNFEQFKQIIIKMFCLDKKSSDDMVYNPGGTRAAELAEKFYSARRKINKAKNKNQKKISILNRYVSILAVGLNKDINSLMNYTIYQIYDEFQRYELKQAFDIHLKAQMAGAKNLKEVDEWMKDLHP